MKKLLYTILLLALGFSTYAQNNVYGKKVVGLDSVVTNSINARAGDVVTVLTALAVNGDVQSQTLNVLGGSTISATVGSDFDDNSTLTNATNKLGRIATPHYTNAEEPIAQLYGRSDATSNQVNIGGGTSLMNAATEINFYTASNTTTTSGTNRLTINSNGDVTFSGDMTFSDYGSGSNTGTAAYSLAVDASGNVIEKQSGNAGTGYYVHEQTITSAEILTMGSSPVTLIPAQGSNTAIILDRLIVSMDYNSSAYSNLTMEIEYSGAASLFTVSSFLNTTFSKWNTYEQETDFSVTTTNTDIDLTTTTGANPTGGNSDIKVTLFYYVITL